MSAENQELIIPAPQPIANPSPVSLMSFDDVARMAKVVVDGGLFQHLKTPQQALTLMLLAQADGLHPIDAVRRYDVINGRPAMKAAAMQAEFQSRGGRIEFHERTDEVCDATFTAPGGTSVRVRWDMKRAAAAGLSQKPGPWKAFPAAMLHARCVSEGVRAVAPGVSIGIYTPEEVQDMGPIDVTPHSVETRHALPPARTVEAPASQAQRDLGSPQEAPAPRRPTPQEIEAISEFGEACSREGIDIMADGPDAQFSKSKMEAEARRLLGLKPGVSVGGLGMWKAATDKLKASGAAPAPATPAPPPSQPMRRTTPEPPSGDFEDLADPFADN
jgi:hypothetical protein